MRVAEPKVIAIRNLLRLGDIETLVQKTVIEGYLEWNRVVDSSGASDEDVKRQFRQLAAWAQAGGLFNIARDSGNVANTTLSVAASAGDISVTVTATTGLAALDTCIIRDKIWHDPIRIASGGISGNVITLDERLNFDYAIGARFRDDEYWPARLVEDLRNPIIEEEPPIHFNVRLPFVEEVNSL